MGVGKKRRILTRNIYECFYKCFYHVWLIWVLSFKCWVKAYRNNQLLVNCNTNNGVERENNTFKHSYLHWHKTNSLTGMLTVVVEDFLTDKYEKYTVVTVCVILIIFKESCNEKKGFILERNFLWLIFFESFWEKILTSWIFRDL